MNSIHSACAAAFARHRGKTGTLHLLQEEIYRLEKAIESVSATIFLITKAIQLIFIKLRRDLVKLPTERGGFEIVYALSGRGSVRCNLKVLSTMQILILCKARPSPPVASA